MLCATLLAAVQCRTNVLQDVSDGCLFGQHHTNAVGFHTHTHTQRTPCRQLRNLKPTNDLKHGSHWPQWLWQHRAPTPAVAWGGVTNKGKRLGRTCTRARAHTHARSHTHAHSHTHMHARAHTHMHARTHTNTRTHARSHTCTRARTHTNTRTPRNVHTNTCTHTQLMVYSSMLPAKQPGALAWTSSSAGFALATCRLALSSAACNKTFPSGNSGWTSSPCCAYTVLCFHNYRYGIRCSYQPLSSW